MADEQQSGGLSRRDLLRAGAVVGVSATVGGVTAGEAAAAGSPVGAPGGQDRLVLVNGKIHTMDADNRVVDEMAIEDGRFVEVGMVTTRAGTVVNLDGHVVVPGIIDNHNHIVLMGNRPGHHTPLENAYSIADVQQTYAARAQGSGSPPAPTPTRRRSTCTSGNSSRWHGPPRPPRRCCCSTRRSPA